MSAESKAEAGIQQNAPTPAVTTRPYTSAAKRQRLKEDISSLCGTTGLVLCAVPIAMSFLIVPALFIAFAGAGLAFLGFLHVLTGQAILRATLLDGYDFSLETGMQVGAVGGAIVTPAVILFNMATSVCFPPEVDALGNRRHVSWPERTLTTIFELAKGTAFGAAVGAVGSAVLRLHGHVTMDPLHAARAGTLGAAILGPGVMVALFVGGTVLVMIIQALPCSLGYWDNRTVNTTS